MYRGGGGIEDAEDTLVQSAVCSTEAQSRRSVWSTAKDALVALFGCYLYVC